MTSTAPSHFREAWRAFKSHPRVFIVSTLLLVLSWVALELAVVALYRLGFSVWLLLHLAFFFFSSGLLLGLLRMTQRALDRETPKASDLTALLRRGPSFLLAFSIYSVAVITGLVLLIVPGIYVAVRYALFGHVLAAKSVSAIESLREAAALSSAKWTAIGTVVILGLLLNLAGAALLGLGLLISFPVSLLAMSDLYRSLRPMRPATTLPE